LPIKDLVALMLVFHILRQGAHQSFARNTTSRQPDGFSGSCGCASGDCHTTLSGASAEPRMFSAARQSATLRNSFAFADLFFGWVAAVPLSSFFS
jgi:hypothetical protein